MSADPAGGPVAAVGEAVDQAAGRSPAALAPRSARARKASGGPALLIEPAVSPKTSSRLVAGSVLIGSVRAPAVASATAAPLAVVVLPTRRCR